jgi:hypothetical protein
VHAPYLPYDLYTVIQSVLVQFNLAVLYRTGSKASPADFDKAVQWHGPIVA